MNPTITLSERTFELLSRRAAEARRPPSELAEEVLLQHLSPPHPYVELVQTTSGLRPMVKGTHIPVSIIVAYTQTGLTPETISTEIVPHISLEAIRDCLGYYDDHKDEIDRERAENTEAATRQLMRERLGEEGYRKLTGQSR